ncbi:MAG: GNAT family N-acetyltransferase [Acidobacteria bacterium]|nr:GNAT family N-acetyltransferase [Acidobacteriota bacterium]
MVRPVRPEEHAEAGRVLEAAWREFVGLGEEGWDRYVRDHVSNVAARAERTLVLVAVEDERILGSATLETDDRVGDPDDEGEPLPPEEARIRMVGVAPGARRRGVGRLLMEGRFEEARRAGKTLVTLRTTPRQKAAHAMYEDMGFARGADTVFDDGFVLMSYEIRL